MMKTTTNWQKHTSRASSPIRLKILFSTVAVCVCSLFPLSCSMEEELTHPIPDEDMHAGLSEGPEQAFPNEKAILKTIEGKGGAQFYYSTVKGYNVFEGDMLLTDQQIVLMTDNMRKGRTEANVTKRINAKWPNGIVYYEIASGNVRSRAEYAMRHITSKYPHFMFIERTDQVDYIRFFEGDGCWSYVGRIGGRQDISIGSECSYGNTIHEVCHALGFFHEQTRPDRDRYISIHWDNIEDEKKSNFQIGFYDQANGPFDFSSIMMYGPFSFSKNYLPTITLSNGWMLYRYQRDGLSRGDIEALATLYPYWINDFSYDAGGWRVDKHARTVADVNGDGKADIIGFGNAGVLVAYSNGNGFSATQLKFPNYGYIAGGWRVDKHPRMSADVNGDGKADIIAFGDSGVWVSYSNGNGFSGPQLKVRNFGYRAGGWRVDKHPRMAADVNGDGKADIIGFGDSGVWVAYSNGNGFSGPQLKIRNFGYRAGGWRVDKHPRMAADVNGDGKADIVGFGDSGVWVAYSTGNGFTGMQLKIRSFGYNAGGWRVARHPRMVADVNGDGRADIIGFANNGVWVAYSSGNSFSAPQFKISSFGTNAGGWRVDKHPREVADVNGDGKADIIGFGQDGVTVSLTQ